MIYNLRVEVENFSIIYKYKITFHFTRLPLRLVEEMQNIILTSTLRKQRDILTNCDFNSVSIIIQLLAQKDSVGSMNKKKVCSCNQNISQTYTRKKQIARLHRLTFLRSHKILVTSG